MISEQSRRIAEKAKAIYESQLRAQLESSDHGRYASIEPESGDYFLGDTLDAAVFAALERYPDRLTYALRIGHPAALHLGVLVL